MLKNEFEEKINLIKEALVEFKDRPLAGIIAIDLIVNGIPNEDDEKRAEELNKVYKWVKEC